MKKIILSFLLFSLLSTLHIPLSISSPAEELRLVTNEQYFQVARDLIKGAKHSLRVMMFEMTYYKNRTGSPTNVLMQELISAKKRGVKVEVILEMKEGEDRTTTNNRQSGKILADGGVTVIYDSPSQTTHTKVLIADDQVVLLGSTNWTYSALSNNNEVSVLIRSREIAKELTAYFNKVKSPAPKK